MPAKLEGVLAEHWSALEEQAPSSASRIRTSALPVDAADGQLLAAVDFQQRRHLLVPINTNQRVRALPFGENLRIGERNIETQTSYARYADICCLNSDLLDLFTEVCSDVLLAVAAKPSTALRVVTTVLQRWRSLFISSSSILTEPRLAGLYAELSLLRELLKRNASAAASWTGTAGHRHDFTLASNAVEVKGTTATEGRRVTIHGLDQLDPPHNGRLWLYWARLEQRSNSHRIVDLISEVLELTDDYSDLVKKLSQVGYRLTDAEWYSEVAFETVESCWYRINDQFPRLTNSQLMSAGVAIDVANVSYSIEAPDPGQYGLDSDAVDGLLALMSERPLQ